MANKLPIEIGCKVKAAMTSKHVGVVGTVLDCSGDFLTVEAETTHPLAYTSRLYPDIKVFQLARHLTIVVAAPDVLPEG